MKAGALDSLQSIFPGAKVIDFCKALSNSQEARNAIEAAKIDLFRRRFAGQEHRYIVQCGTSIWTEEKPVTDALVRDHLVGKRRIGIFPIVDGRAKWCAIDLDSNLPDQVRTLCQAYREIGLPFRLATSKSGNFHFWTFFSEWIQAEKLRALVEIIVKRSGIPEKRGEKGSPGFEPGIDKGRLYPCEAALFLPLFNLREGLKQGRGVFVDPETLTPYELDGQWRTLAQL